MRIRGLQFILKRFAENHEEIPFKLGEFWEIHKRFGHDNSFDKILQRLDTLIVALGIGYQESSFFEGFAVADDDITSFYEVLLIGVFLDRVLLGLKLP